ncbi:TPA: hypothetical protein L9B16_000884 [Klebsiella quasipneumoniae]|jgi:hypothetical protein|uniref:hypothetical protein n=1 Tax=Klebsiella TaxID=570 RepID=UPI000665F509|nr:MULTISPECIES: hypothetical protein [Klebsiella]EIY4965789.1 hypothetical protein [Klebsiella quasipneumoniae]EIY5123660.1 hypothetical protein [Klebsiella quasipneumoniae]MBZ6420593.1 hypothetical protein [Klebsiella sp.]MDT9740364.1 hypothetical protein [Klebsiella quasipneumoniae]MDU6423244.1 hypothetical protein [Klebsiella quasipneumoniae]
MPLLFYDGSTAIFDDFSAAPVDGSTDLIINALPVNAQSDLFIDIKPVAPFLFLKRGKHQ